MVKIEEIKKYISDDILNSIFEQKEDDIYRLETKNEELEKIKTENTMTYGKFQEIIKNLPPHFKNCREDILDALEEYSDREGLIQSYDNEKFFKIGFCEGVKMMIDINKNKND